jgi:hypothetical protein
VVESCTSVSCAVVVRSGWENGILCRATAKADDSSVARVRGLVGFCLRFGVMVEVGGCSMMCVRPLCSMVNWEGEMVVHGDCRVCRSMVMLPRALLWCHGGSGLSTMQSGSCIAGGMLVVALRVRVVSGRKGVMVCVREQMLVAGGGLGFWWCWLS